MAKKIKNVAAKNEGSMAKSGAARKKAGWIFTAGFAIALIGGIITGVNAVSPGTVGNDMISLMAGILVVIGLGVGLLNINDREILLFLVSAMALVIASVGFSSLNTMPGMGDVVKFLAGLTGMIGIFIAPAAVIVALKVIYATAREA